MKLYISAITLLTSAISNNTASHELLNNEPLTPSALAVIEEFETKQNHPKSFKSPKYSAESSRKIAKRLQTGKKDSEK